jgi:Holliday junction resolvase-like predicted endonuclease
MLTENDVIKNVAEELNKTGYNNIETVDTFQKGYDIIAEKNGIKLFIEAKGQTSSKHSNREGKEFTHAQKKNHVAMAVYKTMQTIENNKGCKVGIAFPGDIAHRKIIERIRPSLDKLKINVYFVNDNKKVDY